MSSLIPSSAAPSAAPTAAPTAALSIVDPRTELLSNYVSVIHAQKKLRDEINASINEHIRRHVKLSASAPSEIDAAIVNLRKYVQKFYPKNPESAEPFFASLKENLTMAPITSSCLCINRRGPSHDLYDTVLYEWCGRLIMYVRIQEGGAPGEKYDENFKVYTDLNGFSFDIFKLSKNDEIPYDFYRTWWKSDIIPDRKVRDAIELRIEASHNGSCGPLRSANIPFSERIDGISPEFQLIVAAFDQSSYTHHVINILQGVSHYMPYTDDDTESHFGWDEDESEDDKCGRE